MKTRVNWQVPALVALVLGLSAWLVWNSKNQIYGLQPAPGAQTIELRVGNSRGVVEITPGAAPPTSTCDTRRFRILLRDGFESPPMDAEQFRRTYGSHALDEIDARGRNVLFTLLNITSWTSLLWAGIGLLGQVAFFGRMFVQWVASERRKESVVPEAFWWLSLAGGVLLLTYFVWRQDFVGVLGQSPGIVIYARNIRLIHKRRHQAAPGAAPPGPTK